jgi:CheY-like chemotaxis protein
MAGKRVLIIDDSRSARAFLARMLERHGIEVDGVGSAEEGFAYLRRQLPDALFLDHLMPGMDGFQALAQIKKDARTSVVPVMMYTSQQGEAYLEQARRLGALGVLPKQLGAVDVLAALRLLKLEPTEAELAQVTTVIEPQRAHTRAAAVTPPLPPVAPVTGSPSNTPELRALLQSLAAEQGRAMREQLAQQLLQELSQQMTQQGERLFVELRALRREMASVATATASAPAARAALADERTTQRRAWKVAMALVLLGVAGGVAWLLRPLLWPVAPLTPVAAAPALPPVSNAADMRAVPGGPPLTGAGAAQVSPATLPGSPGNVGAAGSSGEPPPAAAAGAASRP